MSITCFKVVFAFLTFIVVFKTVSYIKQFGNSIIYPATRPRDAENSKSLLIIYWTRVFRSTVPVNVNPHAWPYFYAGNNCPIKCELTTDKGRINEASALVVHARNSAEIPPRHFKNITWILQTNENPVFTGSLRDPKFMSMFNFSISYRIDSDFASPEFLKPSLDSPVPFQEKNGLVVVVLSHCEGVRTKYIGELMKYIKVDSYGACLTNKHGLKVRYGRGGRAAVRELQRGYKFCLVFSNADCDYYVTEKIHSALTAGSVPVWMGTDKVDEILQWGNLNHSIIKVKDFSTPKKLAEYLQYVGQNETEYNTYLKWKYEGFNFPKEYYSSAIGQWWDGLPLYCRVCMRIANDPKGHNGLPVDSCGGNQKRTLTKWLGGQ